MQAISLKSKGPQVKQWQLFLIGQGYTNLIADGQFGPLTKSATIDFQALHNLRPDGVVGQKTYLKAMELGLLLVENPFDKTKTSLNWPPLPDFNCLTSTAERQRLFGKFNYKVLNGGNIQILGNWEHENIISVNIPQLRGIPLANEHGTVRFHRLAALQLQNLFQEWEDEGLMDRLKTWLGAFVPRMVRGSTTTLSNHAFGTAFDINAEWNGLGAIPAIVGEKGSVRELVEIANKHGFYWGGHFKKRPDGMHFEVAVIK